MFILLPAVACAPPLFDEVVTDAKDVCGGGGEGEGWGGGGGEKREKRGEEKRRGEERAKTELFNTALNHLDTTLNTGHPSFRGRVPSYISTSEQEKNENCARVTCAAFVSIFF